MISLRKIFGKSDRFFELLEASAEEARHSVQALNKVLSAPEKPAGLEEFRSSREADKRITDQIDQALVRSFATQLEREDIEVLSAALYKIPKSVEKIAERYLISTTVVQGTDFSKQIELLSAATDRVVELVKLLRDVGGGRFDQAKAINGRLQQIEGEADRLILEILRDLYSGRHEATKVMALKDLHELLEKVVDRCRDAGNIVTHIMLKNS